jgi:DNA-directed RNA polymerase
MQQFNGLQMLHIDIANGYGLDKTSWTDRLTWFQLHEHELENLVNEADTPMLYLKAVKALRATQAGEPSGHTMFLDATASG